MSSSRNLINGVNYYYNCYYYTVTSIATTGTTITTKNTKGLLFHGELKN